MAPSFVVSSVQAVVCARLSKMADDAGLDAVNMGVPRYARALVVFITLFGAMTTYT